MKKVMVAALGGLLLAGAAHAALPPADFVAKAGASDLYEITSSKLVTTSANPKVRTFASEMIQDHTTSTAAVKTAAKKSGLHPKPPMLDPKQSADIAALKREKGAARDTLYLSQQKVAHQDALALHQDNANTSDAPALKAASAKIVPVVEHHISMLAGM